MAESVLRGHDGAHRATLNSAMVAVVGLQKITKLESVGGYREKVGSWEPSRWPGVM